MDDKQPDAEQLEKPTSLEEQLAMVEDSPQDLTESSAAPELDAEQREPDEAEGTQADSLTSESGDAKPEDPDQGESEEPKPEPEVDWKARYSGLQRKYNEEIGNQKHTAKELESKLAALEKQITDQRQSSEAQSLPAYDPRSPKNPQFQQTYQNYQTFRRQYSSVKPELREAVAEAWSSTLTPEDAEQCAQFEAHLSQQNQRFHADPIGTMREQLRGELSTMLDERDQRHTLQSHYGQIVSEHKETIEKHGEEIYKLVDSGYDLEQVVKNYKLQDDLEALRSTLADSEKAKAQAEERKRLARGEVSDATNRDTVPANQVGKTADEIYAEAKAVAKKRGVDPISQQRVFIQILNEVESKYGV